MKTELSAIELNFLVKELQTLIGSRVDKVYQPDEVLLQVHKSGSGKLFLKIEKNALWLTASKAEMPETQRGLCQSLRKALEGKKLTALEQIRGERIVKFTFATQKESFTLYVELFSNGNIILADNLGIIKAALEERAWKDRAIKRGGTYELPPSKKNILALTREDFEFELADTVTKHLAKLGFGKLYALELCARSKTNPETKELSKKQRDALFEAYMKILTSKLQPTVYPDGEISAIKLEQFEEGKPYETFSQAIDSNLGITAEQQKLERKRQKFEAEKAKIQNSITLQQQGLERVEKESVELQRTGELIYEHYQELKEILEELNKAKKKYSLQEIKAKLKGHPKIKNVDPKTGDVIIEVE